MSWDVYARIQTIRKSQPPAEALAALAEAEPAVQGFAPLLNIKAQVLLELDRPQDAVGVAQQALKVNDKHYWTFCTLASAFRRLRRLDDAVSAARQAAERAPANPMLKAKLASLLAEAGNLDAALAVIEEAIAIDGSQAGFRKDRSLLLERLGRLAEARQAAEEAVRISPGDPRLKQHLDALRCLESDSPRVRFLKETSEAALRRVEQRLRKPGPALTVCLDYVPEPRALRVAGHTCSINLYPFCDLTLSDTAAQAHFVRLLLQIADLLRARWIGNINLNPLNRALLDALEVNRALSLGIFDRINRLVCAYTKFCGSHGGPVAEHLPDGWPVLRDWSPGLIVRWGNFELRVIQNYLEDKAGLHEQLSSIVREADRPELFYAAPRKPNWLSAEDPNWNLRKLFTNAGFYTDPCDPHPSLDAWAERYVAGLVRGQLIRPVGHGHYPFFFKIQQILYNDYNRSVRYVRFPGEEEFYSLLAGRKVLFVTPYAAAIAGLFRSGRLFRLYKDIEIPAFALTTIPAPMSIYPNRPAAASWLKSYESLLAQASAAIADKHIDLFFASCGCYGIPLCQDVHRQFDIPAVYFGNHMNTLFGVRQKCSRDFMAGRVNAENWAVSDLSERFRNIDKVDDGRYL